MPRPAFELADILRLHGTAYLQSHRVTYAQTRAMDAVVNCRTAALGGHVEECGQCSGTRISYNSCRNRHCPKCQSLARAKWVEARKCELLPVEYFHVVFTVPEAVAEIAFHNPKVVYNMMFRATAQTLQAIARDRKHLGADLGFFAVLHTWGQNLLHHPHLHCVVPGGGLSPDGERWVSCQPGFFLPVRVLSRLFRRLLTELLEAAYRKGELRFSGTLSELTRPARFLACMTQLRSQEWVVYAKPPFGGPRQVLEYLGRYTHRTALSNERLLDVRDGRVTFQWKDYRSKNKQKSRVMTLESTEFIRRFLMHILPPGFQRIRFFGLLSNRARKRQLERCRRLLEQPVTKLLPAPEQFREHFTPLTAQSLRRCPFCATGTMIRTAVIYALPSPNTS